MRTRSWATVALIVGLALGLVFLWPAPDPFAGVETVALATPSGGALRLPQGVLDGLEIALGERNVRLVARPEEADAVLAIEPSCGGPGRSGPNGWGWASSSLDRDALGQVARLIDVGAPQHRDVISQKL